MTPADAPPQHQGPVGDLAAPAAPEAARTALARSETGLLRLLVALTAAEVGSLRNRSVPPAEWAGWTGATRLDEDGIGLDSLSRLRLVARVERFFQLHRSGAEDHLVLRATLGEWAEVVSAGLAALPADDPVPLGFDTSGTTGEPRCHLHPLADMAEEAWLQPRLMPDTRRVLTLVPPHHLYGFIWTLLGPLLNRTEVVDLRGSDPGGAARIVVSGDAIVGTPFLLDLLCAAGVRFPADVGIVISAGPSTPRLWDTLRGAGAARILEVYGSTETAGIGTRTAPGSAFALLPNLRLGEGSPRQLFRSDDRRVASLPDEVEWTGPARFVLGRRRDGTVKVGGTSVVPAHVRDVLLGLGGLSDAAVRVHGEGERARLTAFLVPSDPLLLSNPDRLSSLERRMRCGVARQLRPPERPVAFRFGPSLPLNEMGKLAAWEAP